MKFSYKAVSIIFLGVYDIVFKIVIVRLSSFKLLIMIIVIVLMNHCVAAQDFC